MENETAKHPSSRKHLNCVIDTLVVENYSALKTNRLESHALAQRTPTGIQIDGHHLNAHHRLMMTSPTLGSGIGLLEPVSQGTQGQN